jgi:hypothetical protein
MVMMMKSENHQSVILIALYPRPARVASTLEVLHLSIR